MAKGKRDEQLGKDEQADDVKTYQVVTPVDFNNERHEPGAQLELSAADAKPLLAVKAIKDPSAGE